MYLKIIKYLVSLMTKERKESIGQSLLEKLHSLPN